MGEAPPDGSETWCAKIVNGQEVKEGPFTLYRDDGSKMVEGEYHEGKQNGEWTLWYDNGQKQSIDHYKNGVQDGEHVETADQIIPALERAFKSGKPAMINVVGDVGVGNATLGGNLLGSTGSN